ncbi:C40 family peptidase [Chryseolinea lacunae]|uniref:C40 family peptidase n=1 Tax=Chryseolinea lacunae TaxID=2801331 RepID=A0ABS1KW98_9BACT|nr:C40 family peptidase [Chryseolinea lacunae]MBL0743715.1 C40 family peptidase [Chryseolinea lacunae]
MFKALAFHVLLPFVSLFPGVVKEQFDRPVPSLTTITRTAHADSVALKPKGKVIPTGDTNPIDLISFAQTLKGTRYKYASASPKTGFDCSGFVHYVFKHFSIQVPRSSVDFTHVGRTIELQEAMPGDLILFTGTNSKVRRVGHMGIVITQGCDSVVFLHASSGKAHSVTETELNKHYKERFIKVVRLFE